jgi:hypothetical protein
LFGAQEVFIRCEFAKADQNPLGSAHVLFLLQQKLDSQNCSRRKPSGCAVSTSPVTRAEKYSSISRRIQRNRFRSVTPAIRELTISIRKSCVQPASPGTPTTLIAARTPRRIASAVTCAATSPTRSRSASTAPHESAKETSPSNDVCAGTMARA